MQEVQAHHLEGSDLMLDTHNENPRDMPIDYRRNALSKRCKYKIHFIYSNHNDFQYILK